MLSHFFIDRPIFSSVIAVLTVLLGAVSLPLLPIEQYPEIAPPVVQVRAQFPGADPQTLVDSVSSPLEQQINGVEQMIYLKSSSASDGTVSIDATFELGTDPDMAAVRVQNRVTAAEPSLPEEVSRLGVTVRKRSPSLTMVVSLVSPDDSLGPLYLSNYATLYVKDVLARVAGVGEVQGFGAKAFAMRIWLDPEKLAARNLTTLDVIGALREQNVQVAAGRIGQEPTPDDSGFDLSVQTEGRLNSVEAFEHVILKVGEDRRVVRVKDVARVELGAQSYDSSAYLNGEPAATLGIFQSPGSNAIDVADGVREAMRELSADYPPGLEHRVTFDFTTFVRASIEEVVKTLLIAALLVSLVTFIFLQDWRATLVPIITIPIALIGTFLFMMLFGFSLNMLTLFGLILAIGIVVDDAIVVVENTSRRIEAGEPPRQAARGAMSEITGALVATTLVVMAVFIPAASLSGMTGVLYRQFAVTIAIATALSTVNALTLSPALCALLLRPTREKKKFVLFRLFDRSLDALRSLYIALVGRGVRLSALAVIVFAGLLALTGWRLQATPTSFIPPDDMGYFFINVQLPDAAKLGRTERVVDEVEGIARDTPGVADIVTITGYSLLTGVSAPNSATGIVVLKPWDERPNAFTLLFQMMRPLWSIQDADVFAFPPPPVMGLGSAGGFAYELQDRVNAGMPALQNAADRVLAAIEEDPVLTRGFSAFRAAVPQLFLDVDRTKVKRLGVPLADVHQTLQTNLGGSYVNDFNRFGRVFRVYAQADARFRSEARDLGLLQVRNDEGRTLPLDTFVRPRDTAGPAAITRYNLFPSASILGQAAPGYSSGEAIARMRELSRSVLPPGLGYEWTGVSFQELEAGNVAPIAFTLGFIVVFLVLAAQYESWKLPLAILATVPMGVLGALLAINAIGISNNIYVQVGFILLISLVAKNAILIVEFAADLVRKGRTPREAAIDAANLRFRPILMTAFSFVLGTLPLLTAVGAGMVSRRSLGTAVFFGMLFATVVGIVLVPIAFTLLTRGGNRPSAIAASESADADARGADPSSSSPPSPPSPSGPE